jgi:hypothetical protein
MKVPNHERSAITGAQDGEGTAACGCASADATVSATDEKQGPAAVPEPNLEDLILLAIVVAAGCESCAENAVARALDHGSPWQHIQKALQIIAKIQKLDCFAKAVGPEVVARMERPLAAGRRTLREAMLSAGL